MKSKNWLYLITSSLVLFAVGANAQEADPDVDASAEETEVMEEVADDTEATAAEESDDEEVADEEVADEEVADEDAADEEVADEEVADEEVADEEVADEDAADEEVADEEVADEEVADEEVADEEVADEDAADEEVADEDAADEDAADEDAADEDAADEDVVLEPTHSAHYTVFAGGGYSLMHGDLAGTGAANLVLGANFGIELTERFAITAGAGYMSRFGGELVDETNSAPATTALGTRHLLSFELGVRGRLGGSPAKALRLGGGFMGLVELSGDRTGFSRESDSGTAFYQEFSPAVFVDLACPVAVFDAGAMLVGLRVVQELAPTIEATGDVDGRVFIEPGDGPSGQAWYTGFNLTIGWEF